MSAGGNDTRVEGVAALEERMEELNLRQNYATVKSSYANKQNASSLPYTINGISDTDTNGISIEDIRDEDVINKIKEIETGLLSDKAKREALGQLFVLIKHKHVQSVYENFKLLLRILLELLEKPDYRTQLIVLLILTEIFKCKELKQCYLSFVELLIVKVLRAHTDANKEVSLLTY